MIRVAVAGAAGRMGCALIAVLADHPELQLAAAFERLGSDAVGRDTASLCGRGPDGVLVRSFSGVEWDSFDVLIDFTRPEATVTHVEACAEAGKRLVIGTTGLGEAGQRVLEAAATRTAIVYAPNMSPGVNLCFRLAELAARALGPEADVEIIEAHHRHKVDAPSGTALRFGELIAAVRGTPLDERAVYGRHGMLGARKTGEIGFSAIRGGDIIGDHTVLFALAGERVEIVHRAESRENFARGALAAAVWVMTRTQGLFDMQDVLGLRP